MKTLILYPIVACAIWHVATTVLIYEALRRRGLSVHFLWLRVSILRYLGQYREITRQETGRIGPLYFHWLVSVNLMLILVVALIALRLL